MGADPTLSEGGPDPPVGGHRGQRDPPGALPREERKEPPRREGKEEEGASLLVTSCQGILGPRATSMDNGVSGSVDRSLQVRTDSS